MKQINHILRLIFIFIGTNAFSQTIVLNACHPLIENQDYTFKQKKEMQPEETSLKRIL